MIRISLVVGLVLLLSACFLEEEVVVAKENFNTKKVWVFAQINVPRKGGDVEDYFYYGKVSKSLYKKIANNEVSSGFILFDDAMYWGNDDIIYSYNSDENEGELIFRIEHTVKIDLVDKAPVAGLGVEQFREEPEKIEESVKEETQAEGTKL